MSSSELPPTPILSDLKHGGIPERNAEQARIAKARLYSNKTLPEYRNRSSELPVLPPGVDREKFTSAIREIQNQIGHENVEVNDKPLRDGWYMEHPYVSLLPSS